MVCCYDDGGVEAGVGEGPGGEAGEVEGGALSIPPPAPIKEGTLPAIFLPPYGGNPGTTG